MKIFNSKKGYTLVEFLIATVVIAVIGMIVLSILNSTFRGTKKTSVISSIRVNGNQAITQMVRLVKFAKKFKGVSKDGTSYSVSCVSDTVVTPTPTPTPVPYKYLKFIAEDGGEVTFRCDDANRTIASNSASLIDTNAVLVVPDKCWFTCMQDRVSTTAIVHIYFQLRQAENSAFSESQFSIPFETSVLLKNLVD